MSFRVLFETIIQPDIEEEEHNEITQEEILDIVNDIILQEEETEEATHEEFCLLYGIKNILETSKLDENTLAHLFLILDDYVGNPESEESNLNEDFQFIQEAFIKKMIRGGKIVKRKKGYRKVGGTYKKIKLRTLRKMKRSARKRRHHKLKAAVKRKMKRTRRKVRRKFKSVLKRFHKLNMAQKKRKH